MDTSITTIARRTGALLLLTGTAAAQSDADGWELRAALYGFFPDIHGSATLPTGAGADLDIDAHELLESTELAGMGSLAAQHGRWGLFTDVIYLDVADSVNDTTALAAGAIPLPPGITADASLAVEGWVWTSGASVRVVETPELALDVLAGVRLLSVETELEYEFSDDFGPFVGPARSGESASDADVWDAVVGTKGRFSFGPGGRWFVPYYVDVGTGESDLTWQAATGLGFTTTWGDVFATWRNLAYEFDSSARLEDLSFRGPAIGIAFGL